MPLGTGLRKTRAALETYKNSGQASVKRLDMAFEEMYLAENANYFSAMGSPTIKPGGSGRPGTEFNATLSTVYRSWARHLPMTCSNAGCRRGPPGGRALFDGRQRRRFAGWARACDDPGSCGATIAATDDCRILPVRACRALTI